LKLDTIFNTPLKEGAKETTYDDVLEFLETVIKKAPKHTIVEELEGMAEHIVILERLLEEKDIDFGDEEFYKRKFKFGEEIEEEKRLFLLHFAGKIVKKESGVV